MLKDERVAALLDVPLQIAAYHPIHNFDGPYLSERHRGFAEAPVDGVTIVHDVEGWLRRADAAAIYELAYFSKGDTADIGTNRGLSAYIASCALFDAGKKFRVVTVDSNAEMSRRASLRLNQLGAGNVDVVKRDATSWIKTQRRRFGFAFVDHSHAYEPVKAVCENLESVLLPGAHVAFHDFIDERNLDPDNKEYDVGKAVIDGLSEAFSFVRAAGCMAIFQFHGPATRPLRFPGRSVLRRLQAMIRSRTTLPGASTRSPMA